MVDIKTNLLKNRRSLSEKEYNQEKKYLQYSVVGLVLTVVVVAGISIWNFVLSSKLSNIEKSLTKVNQEMQGLVRASAEQIYLKSRLNLLTGFLSSRANTRKSLENVLNTEIPGTHISRLGFVDDVTLEVAYEASSSGDLATLLNYYEGDNGFFTEVINKGISKSDGKNYNLNLYLLLPKEDN